MAEVKDEHWIVQNKRQRDGIKILGVSRGESEEPEVQTTEENYEEYDESIDDMQDEFVCIFNEEEPDIEYVEGDDEIDEIDEFDSINQYDDKNFYKESKIDLSQFLIYYLCIQVNLE